MLRGKHGEFEIFDFGDIWLFPAERARFDFHGFNFKSWRLISSESEMPSFLACLYPALRADGESVMQMDLRTAPAGSLGRLI
jgi:hypothetical protein